VICCHPPTPACCLVCLSRRAIPEPEAINCLCGTVKIQVLLVLLVLLLCWARYVLLSWCSAQCTLSLVTPTCPPACCLDDCSTVCVPVVWLTWLCVQSAGLMKMKQAAKKQG
jgi:hypothetical protein